MIKKIVVKKKNSVKGEIWVPQKIKCKKILVVLNKYLVQKNVGRKKFHVQKMLNVYVNTYNNWSLVKFQYGLKCDDFTL